MSQALYGQIDLFDFKNGTKNEGWFIVNDGVMGGLSEGIFKITDNFAIFSGVVSTRNNGGFTMVRNQFKSVDVSGKSVFTLKLKGDGKKYQFRVKSDPDQRHAYIYEFQTSGEWEDIKIPFNQLLPKFRGRSLAMPEYPGKIISETAFLIGNKKEETFELQIERISID